VFGSVATGEAGDRSNLDLVVDWADFRNLTTHQYWRADATIAAEAMERAIPMLVAVVAGELPAAAHAAGVDPSAPELRWSLATVGDQPVTDEEAQNWWRQQRRGAFGQV
jgi:hypothetical protein